MRSQDNTIFSSLLNKDWCIELKVGCNRRISRCVNIEYCRTFLPNGRIFWTWISINNIFISTQQSYLHLLTQSKRQQMSRNIHPLLQQGILCANDLDHHHPNLNYRRRQRKTAIAAADHPDLSDCLLRT